MESDFSGVEPRVFGATPRVDHLGVIGRHRWLVILVVGWTIGLAALYSYTRPTMYAAEAAILVRPAVTSIDSSSSSSEVNPDTESQVLRSTAVARLASLALATKGVDHPSIATMIGNLTVDVPENTEILQVLYSAKDPTLAKEGAAAFADAYLEFRRQQALDKLSQLTSTLKAELETVKNQITDLTARLEDPFITEAEAGQLRSQLSEATARRQIVEQQLFLLQSKTIDAGEVIAEPLQPTSPSSPNHTLDLALGAIVGLGLAFGLAYLRDRRDSGFQSAAALERSLGGIPVLAVIPSFRDEPSPSRDPISLYRSNGPISESYRTLRTAILSRAARSRLVTLAITSSRSGEGKTTTAAMLGIALASAGKRVVLISGDLRRPMSHHHLGVTDRPGLADVLAGRVDSVNDVMQGTAIPNLLVVPSGLVGSDPDPAELLQSDRMLKVLEDCGSADFVLIDSPAVLAVADALVLAPLADGVLFVAAAKGTGQQMIEFAKVQLERMGSNIVGGALIGLRRPVGLDPSYYHRPESFPAVRRAAERSSREPHPAGGYEGPAAAPGRIPAAGGPEVDAGTRRGSDVETIPDTDGPIQPDRRFDKRGTRPSDPPRASTMRPPEGTAGRPRAQDERLAPLPEPPRRRRARAPSDLPTPPVRSGVVDEWLAQEPSEAPPVDFGSVSAYVEPDQVAPAPEPRVTPPVPSAPEPHASPRTTPPMQPAGPAEARAPAPKRRTTKKPTAGTAPPQAAVAPEAVDQPEASAPGQEPIRERPRQTRPKPKPKPRAQGASRPTPATDAAPSTPAVPEEKSPARTTDLAVPAPSMAPRQAIPMPSGSIEPPEASPDVLAPQGGETGDANSSASDPAPSIDPATERVVDPATPRTPPKRRKKRKKPKATPAVAAPAGSSPDEEPTTASAPEQRKTRGDEAGGGPDAGHDADDRGENEAPSPDAESVQ